MKLVLFDIDSTLLRDGGAAGWAFNRAFSEQFGKIPVHTDKYGKTDPVIAQEIAKATLQRTLASDEILVLHSRYCELYPEYLAKCELFSMYPGAVALVSKLAEDPATSLGIQTGNLEPCAWAKLRRANLDSFFMFGGFGSDAFCREALVGIAIERGCAVTGWKIRSTSVVVIGDSVLDIAAGRANRTFTIGVATGKDSLEELRAAGADAVVGDLTDTVALRALIDR